MGFFAAKYFPNYQKPFTEAEKELYPELKKRNDSQPGFTVGEIFYCFLGATLPNGDDLLPAPVALKIPDYVIAFLDNPQNTADLKEIKFKELTWALHICITDACLTMDCMTMMLSAAIRDDMRGV